MSVQFVLGRAGSGKSEYIYKKILEEAAANPEKNFYLFVPEQYTLTAQLKLLALSDTKALFNVEALSFTRFARRVFNELGTGTLDVLEDTGKSLLISKILKENNDTLFTLKNALMNQGGVEELKSLFSEFYQYGVKSEDLRKVFDSDEVDPFFKKKGEDIIRLFGAFQEEISGRFFTAEEIPALLCQVIDSSLLVKNSVFYFDGYTGFTPVQYDVLERMMKLSGKLVFSFTINHAETVNTESARNFLINAEPISENNSASDNTGISYASNSASDNDRISDVNKSTSNIHETDLFYMSEQSILEITRLCEFTGTNILPDIVMPSPAGRRYKEGSRLLFLEENIFSGNSEIYSGSGKFSLKEATIHTSQSQNDASHPVTLLDAQNDDLHNTALKQHQYSKDDLSISLLGDPRDEIEFVCSEISRLVRTGKYHYRDFAVLAAGTADYEDDAPHIFESYGIPYFMDANVSIFFNPLLEFIESALRIVRYGYKSEDVVNFMRTGLADFSDDEIDLFDDYLFSSGYKGKKAYSEDFTLLPEGFSEEELAKINEIRCRLFYGYGIDTEASGQGSYSGNSSEVLRNGLGHFQEALSKKNTTYRKDATALYELLSSYDVEQKLLLMQQAFSDENDEIHAKEYAEIFGRVIEVLDRMVRLLGDSACTVDEFSDDLMMLLSSINVGVLPYSNDCVVIGDIERSRLSEIKILFLVGCHDGNIPGSFGNGGLLSDSEREKLSSLDFHLAPTAREKAFIKKFYLYLALTRSSGALYVCYPKKDKAGNSVLPSYLILDILKLFPDMKVHNVQKNAQTRIYSAATLVPYLASCMREYASDTAQDNINAKYSDASAPARHIMDKQCSDEANNDSAECMQADASKQNMIFALMNALKEYADSDHSNNSSNKFIDSKNAKDSFGSIDTINIINAILSAAFYDGTFRPIEKSLLDEVHIDEATGTPVVQGSISTIESYYTCPYQYFLRYELGLKEKEEYGFRSLDIGNIYHHVLQNYSNIVKASGRDFTTVPDDEMQRILERCIDAEMKELSGRFLFSSASESHIIENVKKTIFRTVKELTLQLSRGLYRPREFEYKFKNNILIPANIQQNSMASENQISVNPDASEQQISNQSDTAGKSLGRLVLNGKIDRIDTGISRVGDQIFVRVVDYKTGDKKLSLENVQGGLELQLFTYLDEALHAEKAKEKRRAERNGVSPRMVIPGGVYFSHVENPILKAGDLGAGGILAGQEPYEDAVLTSYKLNGMTTDDIENARTIDSEMFSETNTFKSSPVTGFSITAKGEISKSQKNSIKSPEDMNSIMETVRDEEVTAASDILSGRFEKKPYIRKSSDNTKTDDTGCQYCPYHDVCLFDPGLRGNHYRSIT